MADIEHEFDHAMHEIYRRAKTEARYTPSFFLNMLSDRGGLATAKQLINAPTVSDGYTALWERGRLDLTVEALVFENLRYHALFTPEEIERARKRLRAYKYVPKPLSKSSAGFAG